MGSYEIGLKYRGQSTNLIHTHRCDGHLNECDVCASSRLGVVQSVRNILGSGKRWICVCASNKGITCSEKYLIHGPQIRLAA